MTSENVDMTMEMIQMNSCNNKDESWYIFIYIESAIVFLVKMSSINWNIKICHCMYCCYIYKNYDRLWPSVLLQLQHSQTSELKVYSAWRCNSCNWRLQSVIIFINLLVVKEVTDYSIKGLWLKFNTILAFIYVEYSNF